MIKKINHIILTIIIALFLALPAYQFFTEHMPVNKLYGVTHKQAKPTFDVKDWLQFSYQPKLHRYLLENYGFRPYFIRIYNQLRFSLFDVYNRGVITYGKEGYLFEPWFISAYYGKNFIGDSLVDEKIKKLRTVIDKMEETNTKLFVILTPGKATYFPEYIPKRLISEKKRTNYEAYRDKLLKYNIPFIDINQWFVEAKDTTRFPLFTKTATHWSVYGGSMALDSITRFMEQQLEKPMAKITYSNIRETSNLTDQDLDLENIMNLMFPLDRTNTGVMDINYISDSNTFKPNTVVISDSFYWILFNLPDKDKLYKDIKYWYYNKEVYPDHYYKPTQTTDLDLIKEVDKTDVFVLMACPATINKFAWGFIDKAYNELVLGNRTQASLIDKTKRIKAIKSRILKDEKWLSQVKQKAKERHIPLDSMLTLDAIWILENN